MPMRMPIMATTSSNSTHVKPARCPRAVSPEVIFDSKTEAQSNDSSVRARAGGHLDVDSLLAALDLLTGEEAKVRVLFLRDAGPLLFARFFRGLCGRPGGRKKATSRISMAGKEVRRM